MAKGEGKCNCTIWSVIWIIILIFLGWPIADFVAFWYILLLPISVCVPVIKDIMQLLEKLVLLPKVCGEGVVSGKSPFD